MNRLGRKLFPGSPNTADREFGAGNKNPAADARRQRDLLLRGANSSYCNVLNPPNFFGSLDGITGGSLNRLTIDGITSLQLRVVIGCKEAPPVRTAYNSAVGFISHLPLSVKTNLSCPVSHSLCGTVHISHPVIVEQFTTEERLDVLDCICHQVVRRFSRCRYNRK